MLRIGLGKTLPNEPVHQFVRNQFPSSDELPSLLANGISLTDMGAEHVSSRDMRSVKAVAQELGLRSFPRARRSEEDQDRCRCG